MKLNNTVFFVAVTAIAFLFFFNVKNIGSGARDFILPFISLHIQNTFTVPSDIELTDHGSEIKRLRDKNAELREMLQLKKVSGFRVVPTEVVIRDPLSWSRRFVVDKGEAEGLMEGCVAIAQNTREFKGRNKYSVIGRVVSLSRHTAEIATVFDEEFSLSVLIGDYNYTGVLKGGSPPLITYLDGSPGKSISGYLSVMTTGFTGNAPPYVPVGIVDQVIVEDLFNSPEKLAFKAYGDIKSAQFILILIPGK